MLGKEISKCQIFSKTQTFRVYDPSSNGVRKKLLYSNTQYHKHHKNDQGTRVQDVYNVQIHMKLKLIFSPFSWTVPSWRINRTRCFRWKLEPLHNATPCTWTSEILWSVELKCWATENPGVLLRILRRCSMKGLLRLRSSSFTNV